MNVTAGDSVVLQSGGPVMTVIRVGYDAGRKMHEALCFWHDGDRIAAARFFEPELRPATPLERERE